MANFDYDLFVIGGGSGGVRASRLAAQLGLRIAIAEEYRFGGTCAIRGCVPKKLFFYASDFSHTLDDARAYGWSFENKRFDWATLLANKDAEIDRISAVYERNVKAAGAQVIASRAEITGPQSVRLLKDGRIVTAERILVATGGQPFIPPIPGHEHAISSNEAFHLPTLPSKILVVGGGYIAVEFACIFHGLGVGVELLYRGAQILRGFDQDLREGLTATMRGHGPLVTCGAEAASIEKTEGGLRVTLTNGEVRLTDAVMFATGRKPNVQGLGLEQVGVRLGENGRIEVDDVYRTSVPSIYALGDVIDRVNLTPVAIRDAIAFIDATYKNMPHSVDLTYVPTAVFSQPEIGTVGLTEEAARATHSAIHIYKSRFRPLKNTLTGNTDRMLMKLVVDADSDKVLGCHLMGPDASEMTQLLAVLLRLGARKADFDATIALHPTLAEELVTMRDTWQPAAL